MDHASHGVFVVGGVLAYSGALVVALPRASHGVAVHLIVVLSTLIVRGPFAMKTARNKIDGQRSATNFVDQLLAFSLGCGYINPLLYCFLPQLFSFADFRADAFVYSTTSIALGTLLEVLCVVVYTKGHVDLGRNFSPTLEIRESHTLTTSGVYKYVRHPMYTAFTLLALGQAFLVPNFVAGWSALVANLAMLGYRIGFSKEEEMLQKEFGRAYDEYAHATARFIPFVF